MVKKSTKKDKQGTIGIRRSSRIREQLQKTSTDLTRSTSTASKTSSVTSKRKRNGVSEERSEAENATIVGRQHSKRVKSINETQSASVVIQDTTIPQVTTIVMQQSKRLGRPPKSTPLSAADSGLSADITSKISIQSKRRGLHTVEKLYKLKLKPKRRKGDTFTVPIPTRPQKICRVYAIGSNEFSQCGTVKEPEVLKLSIISLKQFKIVDISVQGQFIVLRLLPMVKL
jgi:hypothetical protein